MIGKTEIRVCDILERISEEDILQSYTNISKIPCLINSPFRKEDRASFGFFYFNGHIFFKDFGTGESGNLFKFFEKLWGASYQDVLQRIFKEFNIKKDYRYNAVSNKYISEKTTNPPEISIKTRKVKDYDKEYWESYGVNINLLNKAKVYPIKAYTIKKPTGKSTFGAEKYAYAFLEYKDDKLSIKIYQPYSKLFKWKSNFNKSIISLWRLLPKKGDKVIICSSLKDALCVRSQLDIPTIAVQGENYNIKDSAVKSLKERFNKVYVSYDTDSAGIENTKRIAELHSFIPVIPDLEECKDYSDYYKSLENKEEFKKLKNLFV